MLRVVLQAVDEGRHRDASFTDVMDRCEHGKPTTQKQHENRSNNNLRNNPNNYTEITPRTEK